MGNLNSFKSMILLLALLNILGSCGSNSVEKVNEPNEPAIDISGDDTRKKVNSHTEFGKFPYIHHIQNEGPKPTPGDKVTINYKLIGHGDVVKISTYDMKSPTTTTMPSMDHIKQRPSALYDALFLMSEGDSLTVFSLDTLPVVSHKFEIVLVKIL